MTIPASAFTLTAVYKDVGPAADTSLVGGYAFDEASGTAATDASGRGNAGTIGGATRTTGRNGSALSFNGTNNSVSIPDSTSLDLTSGMTLEAWVNPAAVTSWRTVILKETTGDLAYALYSASSYGGVAATRPSAWIGGGDIGATAALPAKTWSHLATTWNGTTWKLYVDGVEKATKAFAGPIPVSAGPLKIGGNAIWSEWFSGRIDDVRIYNRGLTAAEVARDRDTPVGGASPPPPPDTTAPTVSVSAPTAGATVSGSNVAVSATAADNVGVSGVQLRVDGVSLGNEDTTAPYGATWDTTTVANGTHTLTAVARDAAGNSTTSAGVGVTVSNAPLPPPPGGLVAAYGFEEASGASVTDASGRGNVGTITGATRITTGKFGNALSFNGTSNSVLVPDSPSLRLTTGMTLEAWVYQAANTNYRTGLLKEASGDLAYGLYGASTYGSSSVKRPSSWLGPDDLGATTALTLNAWKHLATTYDGANWRLYVDGVQVATKAYTKAIPTSTGAFKIGGNSIWGEYFSGRIDEVRVYDKALSGPEIQGDMTRAVG